MPFTLLRYVDQWRGEQQVVLSRRLLGAVQRRVRLQPQCVPHEARAPSVQQLLALPPQLHHRRGAELQLAATLSFTAAAAAVACARRTTPHTCVRWVRAPPEGDGLGRAFAWMIRSALDGVGAVQHAPVKKRRIQRIFVTFSQDLERISRRSRSHRRGARQPHW
jgi:hypothetical protein